MDDLHTAVAQSFVASYKYLMSKNPVHGTTVLKLIFRGVEAKNPGEGN